MPDMLPTDAIRTLFSQAMSEMYRREVPHYQALIELVEAVNAATLAADPALRARLHAQGEAERLHGERHGAIRVGTAAELDGLRRVFAVMGMAPVGYYDLSVAGLPVHSTAFRPAAPEALARNPFRMFTSLLRLDLLEDPDLAAEAEAILARRCIFTPRLLDLVAQAERQGGLAPQDAQAFVAEALETFRWHPEATVSAETYRRFHEADRLLADVVCFRGPHINHLTPRTLDIDAVQAAMPARGIEPKLVIEGPPRRAAPMLLRQTSFKALREPVAFPGAEGMQPGTHTARFGEIEQRGVALTPKGRALYDRILAETRAAAAIGPGGDGAPYAAELSRRFAAFPDSWDGLRRDGLAFFHYRAAAPAGDAAAGDGADSVEALIACGRLLADPITYEDFLPVSAAGIFQSNLGSDVQASHGARANRHAFEAALGTPVLDEMALYAARQRDSLAAALADLGRPGLLPAA